MSALLAPIMMLIQTGHVAADPLRLRHRLEPAAARRRLDPVRRIVRRHRSHMALGVVTLLVAGLLISPSLVAWMSPTIAGLILAIPMSWASGQRSIGVGLRRVGLLATPEESDVAADHRPRQRAVGQARRDRRRRRRRAQGDRRRSGPAQGARRRSCPRRAAAAAAKSTSTRRWRPPSSTTPRRSKTPASG